MGFVHFLFSLLTILCSFFAIASPSAFTLQGQIIKPNGLALEEPNVSFILQVFSPSPSDCLLYQETQSLNMTNSNGVFALTIGEGNRSGADYADTNDITSAFSNMNSQAATTCGGASPYIPNLSDHRWLRITFDDGSGPVTISQDHKINSVPFASFATEAASIQGVNSNDLLIQNETPGFNLNQSNLETLFNNSNWNELQALLGGTSNSFHNFSSAVSVNGSADESQLIIEGHTTQTNNLVEVRNSSSTLLATISSNGSVTQSTDLTTKNYVDTAISDYISDSIQDTDGNTQIQTEEGANDDTIRFDTAGTERMVISSTGQVGIGTNMPLTRLDVSGAIYSRTISNAAPVTNIDFLSGNVQVSLNSTNDAAFNLCGLQDGGSYTLVLKAQPVGSVPTFAAFSDAGCSVAIPNVDTGNIPLTTTSATTLYTFVRADDVVYVFIAPGFTQ